MPTLQERIEQARREGFSDEQIAETLRPVQATGFWRYPAIAGGGAVSGAESTLELPFAAANALINRVNPLITGAGYHAFPNVPDLPGYIQQGTDWLGITNNPRYFPGAGAAPEAERMLDATARGVGAAVPALAIGNAPAALTLSLGGVSGATSELAREAAPGVNWLPPAVGLATGLAGGATASLLRSVPSAAKAMDAIASDIGASDATVMSAGKDLQDELTLIKSGRHDSALPSKDVNRLLNLRPDQATNSVLRDPGTLQILRSESPDVADQIAGAMLNRSGQQWRNLQPEAQDALLPSAEHQNMLNKALEGTAAAPGAGEKITHFIVGGGVGAGLAHLGLIPGGDILGSIGGEAASVMYDAFRSHMAARRMLEPWLSGPTVAGGLAGQATLGVPQMPLTNQQTQ